LEHTSPPQLKSLGKENREKNINNGKKKETRSRETNFGFFAEKFLVGGAYRKKGAFGPRRKKKKSPFPRGGGKTKNPPYQKKGKWFGGGGVAGKFFGKDGMDLAEKGGKETIGRTANKIGLRKKKGTLVVPEKKGKKTRP